MNETYVLLTSGYAGKLISGYAIEGRLASIEFIGGNGKPVEKSGLVKSVLLVVLA